VSLIAAAVVGIAVATAFDLNQWVSAQQRPAASKFAAVPGEKGGQDVWGAYEPVPNWPKDISKIPGNEGWTFGAGQSVFAESPNRVFVLQRGVLPAIQRPKVQKIGPSVVFPIGRLPWRDATVASSPGNGGAGGIAEQGVEAWLKAGNQWGVDSKWQHTVMIFNAGGDHVESWSQWDKMLQRPHFIAINPYDAQKHVWLIDDHKHAIFKMTNDGKQIVQTIGTYGVPGNDTTHFNRPTYLDWFPDGSFVVADGYNNARVVKFDKDGKYVTSWGERGNNQDDMRPGYFNNVHGLAVDPKTRHIAVNDRNNQRIQIFDENGKFLNQWSMGKDPSDVHLIHIFSDGYLWGVDRGTSKMLKYDMDGNFLYSWGTWGDFPGAIWGVHDFSVDSEGNVYTASVDMGGAQKLRPRKGANPEFMLGKPLRVAWK
jgi:DNA-binding beta-propeller fold protein YncE